MGIKLFNLNTLSGLIDLVFKATSFSVFFDRRRG